MLCYMDDRFVTENDAKVSVLDLGLLRGFAVFEYVRTYGGTPFLLQEHLDRFQNSAAILSLQLPKSLEQIEAIVHELIERSGLPEASIKLLATGSISEDQFLPTSQTSLILFAYPHKPYPQKWYVEGIHAVIASLTRPLPQCKSTYYASAIARLRKTAGARELIYMNDRGVLLEGATSNLFAVKRGCLYTHMSEEVLPGITRNFLLRLVQGRFPVEKRGITFWELSEIEELFLTGSNKEIMPVTKISFDSDPKELPVGNGRVGPVTIELMKLFGEKIIENKMSLLL